MKLRKVYQMKNNELRKLAKEREQIVLMLEILTLLDNAFFPYEHERGISWL